MADKMNGEGNEYKDHASSEQDDASNLTQKEQNPRLGFVKKTEIWEGQENSELKLRKLAGDQSNNDPSMQNLHKKSAKFKGTCDPGHEGVEVVSDKGNCDHKRNQRVSKQCSKDTSINQPGHKLNRDRDNADVTDTEKAKKVLEEFTDNATWKPSSPHGAGQQGNYVVNPWNSGCVQLGEKSALT